MEPNQEVQIALLIQKVEQLSKDMHAMQNDLAVLKSNALKISGGLAVIVIMAGIIGWITALAGSLSKIRVLP